MGGRIISHIKFRKNYTFGEEEGIKPKELGVPVLEKAYEELLNAVEKFHKETGRYIRSIDVDIGLKTHRKLKNIQEVVN